MATSSVSSEGGPIYFFRETEIPYGFLSQWYPSPFTAPSPASSKSKDSMTFLTTEQYMMYHKAILFEDREIADKIMSERDPRNHKSLGRKVKGFKEEKWNQHREEIVEEGNWWKFKSDIRKDFLKKLLLGTGNRLLRNLTEWIWGIGYDAANAEANKDKWGKNLLGKALMTVRDRLQAEEVKGKDGLEGSKEKS